MKTNNLKKEVDELEAFIQKQKDEAEALKRLLHRLNEKSKLNKTKTDEKSS